MKFQKSEMKNRLHWSVYHTNSIVMDKDGRAYSTPTDSPILGRALCLTPRGSPIPGRVSHLNEKFQDSLTLTSDTDALVAKISAMFPTVSETHIKILLKKYYNREAVVISALQVEKHPITTPGPLTMSPSAVRLQKSAMGVYSALQLAKGASASQGSSHFTPLTGTPHGSPLLVRPASGASSYYGTNKSSEGQQRRHQSPKMKLKYLKSIFPKAEETLILDVLTNRDNNVLKASEELLSKGFSKKEPVALPKKKEKETPQPPKKVVTIMKTTAEKNELKQKLQAKYKTVAERVISMALESVAYNEERAEQILGAMLQEEEVPKAPKAEAKAARRTCPPDAERGPILKPNNSSEKKHKSLFATPPSGPNAGLRQGPQDNLLLLDYMPWNGPDPDLRTGQIVKPEGPESRDKKRENKGIARGPAGLSKGPSGLAKGSYQKHTKKSAKIVV
ncbi:uncharacterized protein LOC113239236 isoform X3 [Hyposmocoma kahamanoa]|uniref:uncharacterized protein LOC113239236 isoform X3 n=1 Tax=Hyposmocoma kahamanoa TaxID=1477025 RepID=UPI000E6D979C|nr:uncharacterized protein LOC113239236 isoform X3 [Hyposmocoma kahamanoa]